MQKLIFLKDKQTLMLIILTDPFKSKSEGLKNYNRDNVLQRWLKIILELLNCLIIKCSNTYHFMI